MSIRVVPDAIVPLPLFPDRRGRVIRMERHADHCLKGDRCSLVGEPMVQIEQWGWFHLSQIDLAIAEMQINGLEEA